MNTILLITALLVIPAGFLIVLGDEKDSLEKSQRIFRKNAKRSTDRTQLKSRLEELGRGAEKDYVDFRIKQYGYCAAASALSFTLFLMFTKGFTLATFIASLIGLLTYVLLDHDLTKEIKKRRE